MLPLERFRALTFDCYGTLIDWEGGILSALGPLLQDRRIECTDEELLTLYATAESTAESGAYRSYREVQRIVLGAIADRLGFILKPEELYRLSESIKDWRPFADTVDALRILKRRYRLGIVSNIDDDLFAASATRLEVPFDAVITAQQVAAYKPCPAHFETALQVLGLPREEILHVAQSLFHDIAPARSLGWKTVWVNRRKGRPGPGATPPAEAIPDLEVPDLRTLAGMVEAAFAG